VRKLDYVKTSEIKKDLLMFAREMHETPFNNSPKELLSMVVNPPSKIEKERLMHLIKVDYSIILSLQQSH